MSLNLLDIPFVPCQNRTLRPGPVDLIVVHTNEGPEGGNSAEGLAGYLTHAPSGAGYNVVNDENSAVRTARDHERVWGAGGVNSRAWHICQTGFAAQDLNQWHDPASTAAGLITAELVRQACDLFHLPKSRVLDTRPGNRGICGHGDVSRFYPESQGHTDPGPHFPWSEFIATVGGSVPAQAVHQEDDMTDFFYRDPSAAGAIFYVAGNSRTHVNDDQRSLYVLAAGIAGRKIPYLGDLDAKQLAAVSRVPLVGPA